MQRNKSKAIILNKIRAQQLFVVAYFMILLINMLGLFNVGQVRAAPFYENIQTDYTVYNLLVGFSYSCGVDGGDDRRMSLDDMNDVYDNDEGNDNAGYDGNNYESDPGKRINLGLSTSGFGVIDGMASCDEIATEAVTRIMDYYEIDNDRPTDADEAKSYIINFLSVSAGDTKEDMIEYIESLEGDGLKDVLGINSTIELRSNAWRNFVDTITEPMFEEIGQSLVDNVTEIDLANWIAPALNYCLDWSDTAPQNNDDIRIDLSSTAGLYGFTPVDGYSESRMSEVFSSFDKGSDGKLFAGKSWASIADGEFYFLFRDYARYPSENSGAFHDAYEAFIDTTTAYLSGGWSLVVGPDDSEEGYFYPFGYSSELFFDDVPSARSHNEGFRRGGLLSCQNIEENVSKFDDGMEGKGDGRNIQAKAPTAGTGVPQNTTGNGGEAVAAQPSCESQGGAFSFILCPALEAMGDGFVWFDQRIEDALVVNTSYITNDGTRDAWNNFRNIAYILLIPIMLVMVIGTALNFNFLDAYTVKRALPRLFAAVIFITLSYSICLLMIEVTNVIGAGTRGLISSPFGGTEALSLENIFNPPGAGGTALYGLAIFGGIGIAALSGVTIGSLFVTVALGALALLIVFVLLYLRELLITLLVILAPLAIVAWIFPGNDKPWKFWWQAFSKMLYFFPVVIAVITFGKAFASIVDVVAGEDGNVITTMIKIVAYVGPYFFIPKLFTMAGGALGNIAGMVNDRSKGVFDRGRKAREGMKANQRQQIKAGGGGVFGVGKNSRIGKGFGSMGAGAYGIGKSLSDNGVAGLSRGNITAARRANEAIHGKKMLDDDHDMGVWDGNDTVSGISSDLMTGNVTGLALQLSRAHGLSESDAMAEARGMVSQFRRNSGQGLENAFSRIGGMEGAELRTAVAQVQTARGKYSDDILSRHLVEKAMAGGTYYKNSGEAWHAAGLATEGNENAVASMNVTGRKALIGAGQIIDGGAGFGTTRGEMLTAASAGGERSFDEISQSQRRYETAAMESKSMQSLLHEQMKAGNYDKVASFLRTNISEAYESGDQRRIEQAVAVAEQAHVIAKNASPAADRAVSEVMDMPVYVGMSSANANSPFNRDPTGRRILSAQERDAPTVRQETHRLGRDSGTYQDIQRQYTEAEYQGQSQIMGRTPDVGASTPGPTEGL